MRPVLLVLIVAIAATVAMVMAKGMSSGTNIEKREQYWTKEIGEKLKTGATKDELEAFASDHQQKLKCFLNEKRRSQCEFEDRESAGGTRGMPMRLTVTFDMNEDVVAGHKFATTLVAKEQ